MLGTLRQLGSEFIVTVNRLVQENEYYLGYPNQIVNKWVMGDGIHKDKSTYCNVIIASTYLEELPSLNLSRFEKEFYYDSISFNKNEIEKIIKIFCEQHPLQRGIQIMDSDIKKFTDSLSKTWEIEYVEFKCSIKIIKILSK